MPHLSRSEIKSQDLDDNNILLNWSDGANQGPSERTVYPFRGFFPARYYIIDFELCAAFDLDSDPVDRVVRGVPIEKRGGKLSNYGRHAAPEMLEDEPYCPFRADIWQLGTLFGELFGVSNSLYGHEHRTDRTSSIAI